jgi:hypothetical protein
LINKRLVLETAYFFPVLLPGTPHFIAFKPDLNPVRNTIKLKNFAKGYRGNKGRHLLLPNNLINFAA